jgi:hypothetical protein
MRAPIICHFLAFNERKNKKEKKTLKKMSPENK